MSLENKPIIRAVALDLDGVVYEGDNVIKGAVDTIRGIKERGTDVYFVTNNSGQKQTSIATKLSRMGVKSTLEQIVTSGYAAASLVKRLRLHQEQRVLIIGSEELREEFLQLNSNVVYDLPADFLVVGLDKTFNYERLSLGLNALREGAVFVACNRDMVFPVGDNQVLPACGPMVAALESAFGKRADHVVGKPNTMMLELIARERKFKPHEILVVGDMMESDIAMANRFGCPSVLFSQDDLVEAIEEEMRPKYLIRSIEQLLVIIDKGMPGKIG
ncbi:MAG: HAD-IIA family hydrolase [Desulfobacterales bacterium]|nr:HAD-IIA family hydrolase [Desulfobacterales bacterium]